MNLRKIVVDVIDILKCLTSIMQRLKNRQAVTIKTLSHAFNIRNLFYFSLLFFQKRTHLGAASAIKSEEDSQKKKKYKKKRPQKTIKTYCAQFPLLLFFVLVFFFFFIPLHLIYPFVLWLLFSFHFTVVPFFLLR